MQRWLIFLFLIISFTGKAQVQVNGRVLHSQTLKPIANVHIVIAGYGKGTITNEAGSFDISVPLNTKLIFTALGFDTLWFDPEVAAELDTFILSPVNYELDEVEVSNEARIEDFKKRFLDQKPDPNKRAEVTDAPPPPPPPPGKSPPPSLQNPVEYLYEQFSAEAKEKRAYEALTKWEDQISYWEKRLSSKDLEYYFGLGQDQHAEYWLMIKQSPPRRFENQLEMLSYLRQMALYFGQSGY